ncbi:hypothetical protein GCM10023313_06130 [Mucilaginibacter defluvii]|uniref:Uncharacterized protein n=1 Tax=Mucilaginibacter defluvii TaxID=1196019 RepID=A0ABP9FLS8_9SPHI
MDTKRIFSYLNNIRKHGMNCFIPSNSPFLSLLASATISASVDIKSNDCKEQKNKSPSGASAPGYLADL